MINNRQKITLRIITILSLASFFISSLSFTAEIALAGLEKDKNTGDSLPKREVVLENDQVQVVRLTYPIGTESGMHTHVFANRVVYFVKGGMLTLVPKDSSKASKTLTVANGQTLFLPATTHNVRNVGNTEIIIVETELK